MLSNLSKSSRRGSRIGPSTLSAIFLTAALAIPTTASAQSTTTAVPVNYRKIVAGYFAKNWTSSSSPIIAAEISRPGIGWAGLFDGGNRPIVCTNVTTRGPFIDQTSSMAFFFKGGQIERAAHVGAGAQGGAVGGLLACGNLTYVKFPEAVPRPSGGGRK